MGRIVCVVNDFMGVAAMHRRRGFEVVGIPEMEIADLVQFTGGEDISPRLYNEVPGAHTFYSQHRDAVEVAAYQKARELGKPISGICRGGQLVNVLNGGKLLQHVEGHLSSHMMEDIHGHLYVASSIHHQMMLRHPNSELVGWSQEGFDKYTHTNGKYERIEMDIDPEVVWYPDTRCLCIQGHPEIHDKRYEIMTDTYFWYLNHYFGYR